MPALIGLLIGVVGTLGVQALRSPAAPTGPGADPTSTEVSIPTGDIDPTRQQGIERLIGQIEASVRELDQQPDILPAEDPERQLLFRHPRGDRWLLVLGRARPDDRDRWTVASIRSGPDPLTGEAPERGIAIEGTFDLPGAQGIEAAEFNELGSVGMLLTRSASRARGPGDLYRLIPGEQHARKIDEAVFRFALAPDGDAVVYERALDPTEPLGERELKIFHASNNEALAVRSFEFPREQIGQLGPWGPGGVYLELTLERYGEGFKPESVLRYSLDPFNPTNFAPMNSGQPEEAVSPGVEAGGEG